MGTNFPHSTKCQLAALAQPRAGRRSAIPLGLCLGIASGACLFGRYVLALSKGKMLTPPPKNDMIGLRQRTLRACEIGLLKKNRGLPNKAQTPLKLPFPEMCGSTGNVYVCKTSDRFINLLGEIKRNAPPYYHEPAGDGLLALRWGEEKKPPSFSFAFLES